jgi:hypothetical protein
MTVDRQALLRFLGLSLADTVQRIQEGKIKGVDVSFVEGERIGLLKVAEWLSLPEGGKERS